MEEYENPDGTLRSPHVAAERRARASLSIWDAWVLGWPRISVCDPGWHEWSRDAGDPVATGPLAEGH
jgi:hypothetical protein